MASLEMGSRGAHDFGEIGGAVLPDLCGPLAAKLFSVSVELTSVQGLVDDHGVSVPSARWRRRCD